MCCFVLSRENPKVKGAICNCVLSSSRSRCVEAPRRPALPPLARRSGHRGEPLETPLGATKSPPSFSPLPRALSPFSVSSPHAPEVAAMAAARRRCSKPPRAGPRCPGGPPSLPLPPLHRNRCGAPSFVTGVADSCRPGRSSWPPIRRRPASPVPAEHPSTWRVSPRSIQPPPSSLFRTVAPPLYGHRRPLAPGRRSRAGSLTRSTRPTWPANVDQGPPVSLCGSKQPRYKKSVPFYKSQKIAESCKIRRIFILSQ
jgi:hypothetical protein